MKVGIIGLPNVGKSTLFKASTKKQVDASNYPFCTINPNVGVVAVPDKRLNKLAEVSKSAEIIPTTIEFDGDYTSNLSAVPFCIEHDTDLDFKMHKDPNQNLAYNQIKTDIGSVEVHIYSRAAIVEDGE